MSALCPHIRRIGTVVYSLLLLVAFFDGTQSPASLRSACDTSLRPEFVHDVSDGQLGLFTPTDREWHELASPVQQALARPYAADGILVPSHPRAAAVLRVAARLHFERKISLEQLASLSMRWSAWQDLHDITVGERHGIPLLQENGRLSAMAFQILLGKHWANRVSTPPLTLEQTRDFRERISRAPKSEQYFSVYFRLAEDWPDEMLSKRGLTPFNIVTRSELGLITERADLAGALGSSPELIPHLVLSASAIQAYLDIRLQEQSFKLAWQAGSLSAESQATYLQSNSMAIPLGWPGLPAMSKLVNRVEANRTAQTEMTVLLAMNGARGVDRTYRTLMGRAAYFWLMNLEADGDRPNVSADDLFGFLFTLHPPSYRDGRLQNFAERIRADFGLRVARQVGFDANFYRDWYVSRGIDPEGLRRAVQDLPGAPVEPYFFPFGATTKPSDN